MPRPTGARSDIFYALSNNLTTGNNKHSQPQLMESDILYSTVTAFMMELP